MRLHNILIILIICIWGSPVRSHNDAEAGEYLDTEAEIERVEKPWDLNTEEYHRVSIFNRPLYLGGELQLSTEFQIDYTLDPQEKDDFLELEQAFNFQLFYPFCETVSLYLEGEVQYKNEYFTETDQHVFDKWVWERTEHWLLLHELFGSSFSIQAGRQCYEDQRQWWWDKELDSIRIHYDTTGFHCEIAAARELGRMDTEKDDMDPEEEDIFRLLLHSAWSRSKSFRVDMFGLHHDDQSDGFSEGRIIRLDQEDERDSDLYWYGLRLSGTVESGDDSEFRYWLDVAGIHGDEILYEVEEIEDDDSSLEVAERLHRDVSGWGLDAGLTWVPGLPADMQFTLGFAAGSGDGNPEDNTDRNFRQTGLNEGDMRFQYYGELLNPDLGNLDIYTFALGVSPWEDADIDLVYHMYRQRRPADFLWETDLEADPEGVRDDIGDELDAAINFQILDKLEIKLSSGMFRAGSAFGAFSGETAYRLMFEAVWLL